MSRQPSSELSVADVEYGGMRSTSETPVSQTQSSACPPKSPPRNVFFYYERAENAVWKRIGARDAPEEFLPWNKSIWYMVTLSWVNVFFLALPVAWVSHFEGWSHETTFVLCFIAMIPLQKIFDWGGDEISAFLDEDLRDLLVITLSNAVEATLAMILLHKCELRLLQSTIIGVVLLHLLLIPGTAFFVEGTKVFQQMLQPHHANLNLSLLMIGVLATLVPTAFFAALDRGASNPAGTQSSGLPQSFVPLVSDYVRRDILSMSRGISVILLVIYAMSRVWRHVLTRIEPSRPGMPRREDTSMTVLDANSTPDIPTSGQGQVSMEKIPTRKRPTVHPGVCVVFLLLAVALMAVTAEFLVQSIDNVRETSGIQTEWFGLILLPIVSFSADGVIAIWKFFESNFAAPLVSKLPGSFRDRLKTLQMRLRRAFHMDSLSSAGIQDSGNADDGDEPEFAHGRPIDLSIQFTLWWTPFLVLLGWWTDRPMHLLFDYFEVAMLLGACFLVNYILSDSKTNMAEGLTMISFYAMIATAVWFYPGQPQVAFMLTCPGTVADAVAGGAEGVSDLAALCVGSCR